MRHEPAFDLHHGLHRSPAARRTRTLLGIVPSQDVTRYQARDMPRPTFDLSRTEQPGSLFTILVVALALCAIGAGIVLIQRIGT